jgi:hypothetical protein
MVQLVVMLLALWNLSLIFLISGVIAAGINFSLQIPSSAYFRFSFGTIRTNNLAGAKRGFELPSTHLSTIISSLH